MIILMLVTHMCVVCGMYVYCIYKYIQVHTSLYVCGEQKRTLDILLYHSLLSYLETVFHGTWR